MVQERDLIFVVDAVLKPPSGPFPIAFDDAGDLVAGIVLFTLPARVRMTSVWEETSTPWAGASDVESSFLVCKDPPLADIRPILQAGTNGEAFVLDVQIAARKRCWTTLPTVTAISHASPAVVSSVAHGLVAGDRVQFTDLVGADPFISDTIYFVLAAGLTADAFELALTAGGAAIDTTADFTSVVVTRQVTAPTAGAGDVYARLAQAS